MELNDALKLWREFNGQTSPAQILELYEAVFDSPKGDIVEVGSASGGTTIVLIQAAKETGKKVYSVDPYPVEFENIASYYGKGETAILKRAFADNILNGKYDNIIQFNNDISDCIDKLPNNLSLVFIDGCHEFSFVQREYKLLLPKVAPGGLIYIHDMDWSIGQLSGVEGEGLTKIPEFIKGGQIIHNMYKIKKPNKKK